MIEQGYYGAVRADRVRQQIRRGRATSVENVARRLRDVLRSEILSGSFSGDLLPREAELMLRYDVRRSAVRRALSMLRDEGVVERVQGLGTFAIRKRHVADLEAMHAEVGENSILDDLRARVLDRTVVSAPDHVALRLDLSPGEQVLRLEYIAELVREPLALCTNYIAFPQAESIARTDFQQDYYTLLSDAGLTIGGTEWVLSAINADEVVADHLDIVPGTALMLGEEMIWDETDRPYDFAVVYMRTDRFAWSSKSWTIGTRAGASPLASTAAPGPGQIGPSLT